MALGDDVLQPVDEPPGHVARLHRLGEPPDARCVDAVGQDLGQLVDEG